MKQTFFKQLFLLLLAVLLLLSLASACGKKDGGTPAGSTGEEMTSSPDTGPQWEYDANGFVKDNIPKVNYDNREISILCWLDDANITMLPNDKGKDQISSELYLRRLDAEERLGVIYDVQNQPGSWAHMETFLGQVEKTSDTGDAYDVVCSYSSLGPTMATRGLLTNLNDLTYPETEMPWWPESVSEWSQYGSLFYIASNSSVQNLQAMLLMYCNSDMFTSRGMTDPVELVLDGTWTMDTMLEMVKQFAGPAGAGPYGLVVDDSTRMDAFYYGCGFRNTQKNEDGRAELAYANANVTDRITTLIDKMVPLFKSDSVTIANNTVKAMLEDETALMVTSLYWVQRLEDFDYCPIPIPKLDSNQQNYITVQSAGFDVWSIPAEAGDTELSGMVIESIASADYRKIAPLYYENNIKLRYSQSEAQAEMFDMLRNSITYDFGRINQVELHYRCEATWRLCFVQKSGDVYVPYAQNGYAASLASNKTTMETELAELLISYRKYS